MTSGSLNCYSFDPVSSLKNVIMKCKECCMNYYLLYPEVAGELGDGSEVVYEDGQIKEVIFL